MKQAFKDLAFVLKKKPLLNRNILIDLFAREHGHIALIAYNAGKLTSRRGPHLETGNLIKIEAIKKNDRYFLSETSLVSGFSTIKEDLTKTNNLYAFLFFLENILPEGVNEERVFDIFKAYLVALSKESSPDAVTSRYINLVLVNLGYLRDPIPEQELKDFVADLIGNQLPAY